MFIGIRSAKVIFKADWSLGAAQIRVDTVMIARHPIEPLSRASNRDFAAGQRQLDPYSIA